MHSMRQKFNVWTGPQLLVLLFHISAQEPVSLFGENKVFPLAKLDRTLTTAQVQKFVEEEESK